MYTLLWEGGRWVGKKKKRKKRKRKQLQSCESSLKKINYPLTGEEEEGGRGGEFTAVGVQI